MLQNLPPRVLLSTALLALVLGCGLFPSSELVRDDRGAPVSVATASPSQDPETTGQEPTPQTAPADPAKSSEEPPPQSGGEYSEFDFDTFRINVDSNVMLQALRYELNPKNPGGRDNVACTLRFPWRALSIH